MRSTHHGIATFIAASLVIALCSSVCTAAPPPRAITDVDVDRAIEQDKL